MSDRLLPDDYEPDDGPDEPEGLDEYRAAEAAAADAALREEIEREIDALFAPVRARLIRQALEIRRIAPLLARLDA